MSNLRDVELEFLEQSNLIEGVMGLTDEAVEAWEYAKAVDIRHSGHVLHIHNLLMQKLNPRIAGRLRDCNVRVGTYVAPDYTLVSGLLDELLQAQPLSVSADKSINERDIKMWHVEFERIHPFADGNGRTGRIIMNCQRLKVGLPIQVIRESDVAAYYAWFRK
jgi:Fic family protein